MSIRKYHIPDFKDFVKLLKEHGFKYMQRYKKAQALVGESESIWFIERYLSHNGRELGGLFNDYDNDDQTATFLDFYVEARQTEKSFSMAVVKAVVKTRIFYEGPFVPIQSTPTFE